MTDKFTADQVKWHSCLITALAEMAGLDLAELERRANAIYGDDGKAYNNIQDLINRKDSN